MFINYICELIAQNKMTTGPLLNMRESFVQGLLRKSMPQSKSLLGFQWTCWVESRLSHRPELLFNIHGNKVKTVW